jgi:peptide/nickel transport system permease protein
MTVNVPATEPPVRDERAEVELTEASRQSRLPGWFVILWRNRKCRIGILLLAVYVVIAIFAPLIAPYDPRASIHEALLAPSASYPFGTNADGEDVLSQVIFGTRTSLIVGIVAGILATVIGLAIGLTAGYLGGWVDEVLSFFINLGLVIPVLPLMITLAAYAPVKGVWLVIFVIAITGWAFGARIKRSQVITLRSRDYITAAKFAGDGTPRILLREVIPNMASLIVVGFMGGALGAIGAEAGLSYLGLGDPQTISWGGMLNQASTGGALVLGQWGWIIAPGAALALLITAFTLINFGVDALSNPQLRED